MKKTILLGLVIALGMTSCEKEEDSEKTLAGKWTVSSSTVFGATIPGDGSYLKFDGCATECTGEDYKADNSTKGTFTYEMNSGETVLTIADTDAAGGSWNGAWEVTKFTATELNIQMTSLFGLISFKLTK